MIHAVSQPAFTDYPEYRTDNVVDLAIPPRRTRARVVALDHFNVVVADLDRSEAFYRDMLSLESCAPPCPLSRDTARWIYDDGDRPILHLNSRDAPRVAGRDDWSGDTGAVHHIALRCEGHDDICARLDRAGHGYQTNLIDSIGLRQIFVRDPDGVLLELNFFDE
ncbi:glyoxalase/bleomycin resistance/extradiol dioxygenase family protein [Sphingobium sp. CAP-1]|nr:glyoxalase/bleomycin resistance/extradiol dioxygenase family protein [Sphingobium sp. CAP-1]